MQMPARLKNIRLTFSTNRMLPVVLALALAGAIGCASNPVERVRAGEPAERARAALDVLGGPKALKQLHYLSWETAEFHGGKEEQRRLYVWDRWTGDCRMEILHENRPVTLLFNSNTGQGQAFDANKKVLAGSDELVRQAVRLQQRDAYWLLAPTKLLDPGTQVADGGVQQVGDEEYPTLYLTFVDENGAPGPDRYWFHFDPETGRPAAWTLALGKQKKTTVYRIRGWQAIAGVTLPTEFEQVNGKRRVTVENLYAPGKVDAVIFKEAGPDIKKRKGVASAGSATSLR